MKHACAAGVQASKSLKEAAGRTEMKGKRAVVTGAASGIGKLPAPSLQVLYELTFFVHCQVEPPPC